MAVLHFTLSSFGGGLVTSVDEPQLTPDQSPNLRNVDITFTNAVTRRAGYAQVSASLMTSAWANAASRDVRHIGRFYPAVGNPQWVCVAGTALWTKTDGTRDVPLTRKEFTTGNVGGTGTAIAYAGYSGGGAVYCAASAGLSCTVPYSTGMSIKIPSASCSVKVTAGAAWASLAASIWTPSYTATTTTIYMKPALANTRSLKVTLANYGSGVYLYEGYRPWPMRNTEDREFEFSFYDSGAAPYLTQVLCDIGATAVISRTQLVGIRCDVSTTNYVAIDPSSGSLAVTPIVRATGWHTVRFVNGGGQLATDGYLDIYIGATRVTQNYLRQRANFGISLTEVTSVSGYFDRLNINKVCQDDCGAGAPQNWTHLFGSATSSAYTCVKTRPNLVVDYVDYWAQSSWVKKDTTLSATANGFAIEQMGGKAYYGSDWDQVQSYDGTNIGAVSASGSMAGARFLKAFKNRLWAAGKKDDTGLLEYTKIGYPEVWVPQPASLAGAIRVAATGSGHACTGLEVFRNKLYWFSHSKMHEVMADGEQTSWTNHVISDRYGCIAPDSLVAAPNALIFLSAGGVMSYGAQPSIYSDDGSGFANVSQAINNVIMAYPSASLAKTVGAFYDNRYFLALGATVYIADFDKRTKLGGRIPQPPWTRHVYTGLTVKSLHVTRGDEYGIYAGGNDGKLYRLDYGESDNGAAGIALRYDTPPLAPKGYATTKVFRGVQVAVDSSNITQSLSMTPSTDDVDGTSTSLAASAKTDIQPIRAEVNARGRSLKLSFSATASAAPLTVSQVDVTYLPPRTR